MVGQLYDQGNNQYFDFERAQFIYNSDSKVTSIINENSEAYHGHFGLALMEYSQCPLYSLHLGTLGLRDRWTDFGLV